MELGAPTPGGVTGITKPILPVDIGATGFFFVRFGEFVLEYPVFGYPALAFGLGYSMFAFVYPAFVFACPVFKFAALFTDAAVFCNGGLGMP